MAKATIKAEIEKIEKRVSKQGNTYMLLHFGGKEEPLTVSVFKQSLISWIEGNIKAGTRVECVCDMRPNRFGSVGLILDTIKRGRRGAAGTLMATSISGTLEEKEDVRISKTTGNPYMVWHVDADDSRTGEIAIPMTVRGQAAVDYYSQVDVKEDVHVHCCIFPGKYGNGNLYVNNVIRARTSDGAAGDGAINAEPAGTEPEAEKAPEPKTPEPAEPVDTTDTGSADEYGGAVSDADREFLAAMFGDMPSEG